MSAPSFSIIVPVLNESNIIVGALEKLQKFRELGHELVVVDGGSRDNTVELASPLADQILITKSGRAHQMNIGAQTARHSALLFLHSDTEIPLAVLGSASAQIGVALHECNDFWGFFRVQLSAQGIRFSMISGLMNLRSRMTQVATGDQCLFVSRDLFIAAGRYENIPLMEDVSISKRLRRLQRPLVIEQPVVTSARRWQRDGIARTVISMWFYRAAYSLGASPSWLHRLYYPD